MQTRIEKGRVFVVYPPANPKITAVEKTVMVRATCAGDDFTPCFSFPERKHFYSMSCLRQQGCQILPLADGREVLLSSQEKKAFTVGGEDVVLPNGATIGQLRQVDANHWVVFLEGSGSIALNAILRAEVRMSGFDWVDFQGLPGFSREAVVSARVDVPVGQMLMVQGPAEQQDCLEGVLTAVGHVTKKGADLALQIEGLGFSVMASAIIRRKGNVQIPVAVTC